MSCTPHQASPPTGPVSAAGNPSPPAQPPRVTGGSPQCQKPPLSPDWSQADELRFDQTLEIKDIRVLFLQVLKDQAETIARSLRSATPQVRGRKLRRLANPSDPDLAKLAEFASITPELAARLIRGSATGEIPLRGVGRVRGA